MKEFDTKEISIILKKIALKNADLSEDNASQFVFHMSDWLAAFENLAKVYENIAEQKDSDVYAAVLEFLIHAPSHANSAAQLFLLEDED